MEILIILWVVCGFGAYLYDIFFTENGNDFEMGIFIISGLLGGFVLIYIVISTINESMEEKKYEKEREESAKKAKATREKKKLAAKKSYKETLKKLQVIKEEHEQEEKPLEEGFFKDAIKLASDISLIKKEEVEDGSSIFSILKFARLNVFSSLEDEEKAQKYADKLRSSLKKLSSFGE